MAASSAKTKTGLPSGFIFDGNPWHPDEAYSAWKKTTKRKPGEPPSIDEHDAVAAMRASPKQVTWHALRRFCSGDKDEVVALLYAALKPDRKRTQ
jgi:hypothetical protein